MGIIKIRDGDKWKTIPALMGPRGQQGDPGKPGPYYEPDLHQNGDLYFNLKGQEDNVELGLYAGNIKGSNGFSPEVYLYNSVSADGTSAIDMHVSNPTGPDKTYRLLTFDRTMRDRYSAVDAKYLGEKFDAIDANLPRVFIDGVIPTTKDDVLAELRYESSYESFHAYIKIKCQGSSSMKFDKKNFTVKLYEDADRRREMPRTFRLFGEHASNKFVLKANWVDHTHARNIIGARLWSEIVASRPDYNSLPAELRNSPNNGAINGFPVKVYTNGNYQGIYTWNIGKDEWMFGMDKNNPNHVVLGGETNTNGIYTETPCNFRALWSGVHEEHWGVEIGENSEAVKTCLNNLIGFVMNATDDQFKQDIDKYLDIQSAIDYYLFMYVNGGFDNLAKNMLLLTYDLKKWYCSAYDMDIFWGCNGLANVFLEANKPCPEEYGEQYSLLWERIEKLYATELRQRYPIIREKVLNFANIVTKFERFVDSIGNDLLKEDIEVYPDIPLSDENHIKQMRNFVRNRLDYVDDEIEVLGTGLPVGVQYMLTEKAEFNGVDDVIDTGVQLFDVEKSWTIFMSFTGADWVHQASVFDAQYPGWGSGISLYSYASGSSVFYTTGGGNESLGGFGRSQWLFMADADPTTVRYNIVFRWDKDTGTYKWATSANGNIRASGEFTATYRQHMLPLILGAAHENGTGGKRHYWNGTIHKAGIWFKSLTDAEATSLLTTI